jgi:hypothetical protein
MCPVVTYLPTRPRTSTCNSHSVGSSVENQRLNVHGTGQTPVVHPMSYGRGMIDPCPSTTVPSPSGQAITGLQAFAWALSPMSTPAKKTDEYFKSTMRKDNCWWVVDCGDDPYGTL